MKTYTEKLKDPRWQKKRLEILERDDFSCKLCGNNKNMLHVHHIAYKSGDPWMTNNDLLATLCEDCHNEETMNINYLYKDLVNEFRSRGFMADAIRDVMYIIGYCGELRNLNKDFRARNALQKAIQDDELWDIITNKYNKDREEMNKKREEERKAGVYEKLPF